MQAASHPVVIPAKAGIHGYRGVGMAASAHCDTGQGGIAAFVDPGFCRDDGVFSAACEFALNQASACVFPGEHGAFTGTSK
jgi:hypothetical protein